MDVNKDFWEDFIELYRNHSCLWNVKCKDYSNKIKRNSSYEILLKKLKEIYPEATTELLKKKINNMRTTFRRELKKVESSMRTGSSTENVYEPSLWYYDLLYFTAQCETGRNGVSNDIIDEDEAQNTTLADNNSNHESDYGHESLSETSFLPPHTPTSSLSEASGVQYESNNSSSSTSAYVARHKKRKQISQSPHGSPKLSSMEAKKNELLELAHSQLTTPEPEEDEYAVVGKRIAFQLKGMNEHQRLIAEKLVSDIMYYGRMGQLKEDALVNCSNPLTAKHNYQYTSSGYHPNTTQPQFTNLETMSKQNEYRITTTNEPYNFYSQNLVNSSNNQDKLEVPSFNPKKSHSELEEFIIMKHV